MKSLPAQHTVIHPFAACLCLVLMPTISQSQQPANSDHAVHDTFDRTSLGQQWRIAGGTWKVVDNALRGNGMSETPKSATITRAAETGNAVYQFQFMLTENCESLRFSTGSKDPKTETLQSHLSLRITPQALNLCKATTLEKDSDTKPRDAASPEQTVNSTKLTLQPNRWYKARVMTWGPFVTVAIDGKRILKGSDPSFTARNDLIGFQCIGGPIEIDDVDVWTQTLN